MEDEKTKIESLIDKFISDLQEEYQKENANKVEGSRPVPVVSAVSPQSYDIDKKISDLEDLIKKLQIEISDLSIRSSMSENYRLGLKQLSDVNESDSDENEDDHDNNDCKNNCIPQDVNAKPSPYIALPLDESKKFDDAISDLLKLSKKISESCTPTMSDVKETINRIIGDETQTYTNKYDGLEEMIDDLKSDISKKINKLNEPYDQND